MKTIVLYSDGACSGNPGPGGWGAVLGLPNQQVIELGGRELNTTNNQMELQGLIAGLDYVKDISFEEMRCYTDSSYILNGVLKWMKGWSTRGWKNAEGKEIANKLYWIKLQSLLAHFAGKKIKWFYVRGHTGVAGNERCDEIAVAFSHNNHIDLYQGENTYYGFDVFKPPVTEAIPENSFKKKEPASSPAYYLSLKNGILERHATWPECEQRVKGAPGVKFKKVKNRAEEEQILKGWGHANKK